MINFPNGRIFQGRFGEDVLEDNHGIIRYSRGSWYEGEIHNYQRHGRGCHFWSKQSHLNGEWIKGVPQNGVLSHNGQVYVGAISTKRVNGEKNQLVWTVTSFDGDMTSFLRSDKGIEGPIQNKTV